jgi:hypothetical protein
MIALSGAFILVGILLNPPAASSPSVTLGSPTIPWTLPFFSEQISLHVVSGFLAGAVSLNPAIALVGAGVGPLIDFDHVSLLLGLPIDARSGHSIFIVLMMVLIDRRFHLWSRGTRNFLLFISSEYSVHLAVAPPGFPVLSPLTTLNFYFPSWVPGILSVALLVGFFFDCRAARRGRGS